MTTAITSIADAKSPLALAEALPNRHLHWRADVVPAAPRSPYFVDVWTRVREDSLEDCPAEDLAELERFVEAGGRLEICDAAEYSLQWSLDHLFRELMIREFADRDLEQPLTEASFERCLRPGVWLAIAWSNDVPVAMAILQPCGLSKQEADGAIVERIASTRDRLVVAARDERLRRILLAALPAMSAAHGVCWLRARRRPWAVPGELNAWAHELAHASGLVLGFRAPGDVLLFRPELVRAGEAIVFFVSRLGELSAEVTGDGDTASEVCRLLNGLILEGKVRSVGL